MSDKYIQYSNSAKEEIISVFSAPQDDEDYPNQGVVKDNDPRLIVYENLWGRLR